jgi:DNA helicase II / ATP-dependent DNA helicase PcrA
MDHTDEQIDILNSATASSANLMISALAGTGKTTTLEAVERAVPRGPVLYLVFNKKNAIEAEKRMLSTTTVRTFNSIGHRIWAASQSRRLKVDGRKSGNILKSIIDSAPKEHQSTIWSVFSEVTSGVAMAKALGYIPDGIYPNAKRLITRRQLHSALDEEPNDLAADLIDAVLTRSIKESYSGSIDYDDQIYMPALFGGTFPRYPLVLVDEYQDLSPVNHALLKRLVKGRLIGVGDPYQNIYGFRGASAGGMQEAEKAYSCTPLPLSTSFRCPSEIVKAVHWRVPHFRWIKEGGHVEHPSHLRSDSIPDDSTIICRNNAPLLGLGFRLLGAGRSISVAGTDIGPRLIGIMKKLCDEHDSRNEVLTCINEWEEAKLAKESKSAEDMAACMRIFASKGKTLGEAIRYAEHLFKQDGRIYLTTGHKAKGLEWDTVIHLDPWLVRKDHTEQDKNLDYVVSTRSRDRLIEIDSERIEW